MKLTLPDATHLSQTALTKLGYAPESATLITQHILDSHKRGFTASGLPRILSIRDRLLQKKSPQNHPPADHTSITRQTPATAQLNGHDTLGYLVAHAATTLAIEKAQALGIAMVGASNTWYTGMLSYYAELCAAAGFVSIISSNTSPWVAAHGGYEPLNGTNPFCIGFPRGEGKDPVIWDVGTSKILHADVLLAQRLGKELPPESAFDKAGKETMDPVAVLERGALAPWGGAKGSGLALCVQLLGVLAGSAAFPPDLKGFGFSVVVIDPAAFRDREEFYKEVEEYVERVRGSLTVDGKGGLRVPFERSAGVRREVGERGEIEVEEEVYWMLRELVERE